jgi:MFS family permease
MDQNGIKIKKILELFFPKTKINKSLRILIITNSILVFIIGLFAPFYAVFIQHIGGSIVFAGSSWAIFSIVAGVLMFLFSNWELKVKEQELLIVLGYLLRSGVFISYAFMTSITQLIVTQVLWGIATAFSTPAFDSVYSDHITKENSIVEWGQWEAVSAIVTGIAALLGGLFIQVFGYRIIFTIMAVVSAGLGIYIWKLPREVL